MDSNVTNDKTDDNIDDDTQAGTAAGGGANDPPSALSHVSLGTNRFDEALAFYDAVLAVLGIRRLEGHPGTAAYGKQFPEFWLHTPIDGQPATAGNGSHVAFLAADRARVDAFWQAALAAGARGEGEPGGRPHYGAPYYGCFVRDLDGHKIEASCWDEAVGDSGSDKI